MLKKICDHKCNKKSFHGKYSLTPVSPLLKERACPAERREDGGEVIYRIKNP
jgi:hypothetical protein